MENPSDDRKPMGTAKVYAELTPEARKNIHSVESRVVALGMSLLLDAANVPSDTTIKPLEMMEGLVQGMFRTVYAAGHATEPPYTDEMMKAVFQSIADRTMLVYEAVHKDFAAFKEKVNADPSVSEKLFATHVGKYDA